MTLFEDEFSLDSLQYLKKYNLIKPPTPFTSAEDEIPSYISPIPRERPMPRPRFLSLDDRIDEARLSSRILPPKVGRKKLN